jgi:hypothetical protein
MADIIPDGITFSSLEKSGAPRSEVSAIKRWYDRTLANQGNTVESKIALAKLHVKAAGEGLRAGGESLLIGGALGAVHAKLPGGLDMKVGTGANIQQVPIDAVVGVLGLVGGAVGAQMDVGKDLQNAGSAALAIFAFRKTNDLMVTAAFKAAAAAGQQKTPLPVTIGHPVIAGEGRSSWAHSSAHQRGQGRGPDMGEDPIATAARGC